MTVWFYAVCVVRAEYGGEEDEGDDETLEDGKENKYVKVAIQKCYNAMWLLWAECGEKQNKEDKETLEDLEDKK